MTENEYAHGPNPLRIHLAEYDRNAHAACGRPGAHRLTDEVRCITCKVCQRIAARRPARNLWR